MSDEQTSQEVPTDPSAQGAPDAAVGTPEPPPVDSAAATAQALAENLEIVDEEKPEPAVSEPGKLLRIAVMLRGMQEEVRRAAPDQAGRERLKSVHDKAVDGLAGVLSKDLRDELSELTLPFDDETPTESEILIAQAQLLGWLEGLFQGIQAAMFSQQMAARQQFEQMRQRGLPPGMVPPGEDPGQGQGPDGHGMSTGQYL